MARVRFVALVVAAVLVSMFVLVGVGPPPFVVYTDCNAPYHTPGMGTWEKCRDPWESWERWPIPLGLLEYVTVTVETGEIGLGSLERAAKPIKLSAQFEPRRTALTLELVALVWACVALKRRQRTKAAMTSGRSLQIASGFPGP